MPEAIFLESTHLALCLQPCAMSDLSPLEVEKKIRRSGHLVVSAVTNLGESPSLVTLCPSGVSFSKIQRVSSVKAEQRQYSLTRNKVISDIFFKKWLC